MDWFEAIILGIIQGLTEFLPISSTGHLYLGRHLFGLDEAGLFLDTMLHLGTLIAVVLIYREQLLSIIHKPFGKLTWILAIGTIPAVVVGVLLGDFFDTISKTGATIGWEFILTGVILWGADSLKNLGTKNLEQISYKDALIIGTFQAAAIFPALSRSGLTIAAAIFRGLDKSTAAYFSFLLSIPAIAGGVLMQGRRLFSSNVEQISILSLLFATIASLIFGYIAIKWMLNILKRGSLKIFSIYVLLLGCLILILQVTDIY